MARIALPVSFLPGMFQMPAETRDAPLEAPPTTDRIAASLDAYRMPSPSMDSDMATRADNDRYMMHHGFRGAVSLLGPGALGMPDKASGDSTVSSNTVVKSGENVELKKGAESGKKPAPLKEFDPACVAAHAGTSPRPLSLMVELAGADKSLPLTTWPVATDRAPGERILATAAHGFVRMPHEHSIAEHKILDEGFKALDTDKSGTLSREEVGEALKKEQERERTYTPPKERAVGEPIDDSETIPTAQEPPFTNQIKYVMDNYDAILATTRRLDPSAVGVSNEGLAQHLLENAKARIQTPCGDIPVDVVSGDRRADVAILRASGLSAGHEAMIGRDYVLADRTPRSGESLTLSGYPGNRESGATGAPPTESTGNALGFMRSNWTGEFVATHTAETFGGMSGGPARSNETGEVLGLVHGMAYPFGAQGDFNRLARFSIVYAPVIREMLERGRIGRR